MDQFTLLAMILLVVVGIGISLYYFQSHQAKALRRMAEIEEKRLGFLIKGRRDEMAKKIEIEDPFAWLSELLSAKRGEDITLSQTPIKLLDPPAVDALATNGKHVLVSSLKPAHLKRALRRVAARENGAGFSEHRALLSTMRRGKAHRLALVDDQTSLVFDLEVEAVGDMLEVNWGASEELWFMVS